MGCRDHRQARPAQLETARLVHSIHLRHFGRRSLRGSGMVEQLAPQGWSPVDNIPSLNLGSVFAAPQFMSLNLSSPSLRSWNLISSDLTFPTCDYQFDTTKYQQKSDSKNGMMRTRRKSIMT